MWIGDTHANIERMDQLIQVAVENNVDKMIQVGDFGWWPRQREGQRFIDFVTKKIKTVGLDPLIFIPGNHEDWDNLEAQDAIKSGYHRLTDSIYTAGRGTIDKIGNTTVLFVGGAQSVDKDVRTPGFDWFPQEEISQKECNDIIELITIVNTAIDIMVCHDTIDGIALPVHLIEGYGNVRRALRAIADVARPKKLIHGHYHINYWVNQPIWGDILQVRGLSHDNRALKNQYMIEDL